MKIQYCSSYEEMSQCAYESFCDMLKASPSLSVCAATGYSPERMYEKMVANHKEYKEQYKEMRLVKLDEWLGLSASDPNTCEYYIRNKIMLPLEVPENQYLSFKSDATNPEEECKRVQKELDDNDPIDVCFLGLGKNGHLGFNEPSKILSEGCHLSNLSEASLQHGMIKLAKDKPKYGLTLGMNDILRARKIILLVTGLGKEEIIKQFLTKKITPQLPVSYLWNHPDVECYIDSTSLL